MTTIDKACLFPLLDTGGENHYMPGRVIDISNGRATIIDHTGHIVYRDADKISIIGQKSHEPSK